MLTLRLRGYEVENRGRLETEMGIAPHQGRFEDGNLSFDVGHYLIQNREGLLFGLLSNRLIGARHFLKQSSQLVLRLTCGVHGQQNRG